MYRSRDFDIILDCTSFTSKSEVPLQWLKYCAEVIPMDIRVRFSTTRILNANTLTQKYLRRLYNISAGVSVCHCRCSFSLMRTRHSTLQWNKGLYLSTPATGGCGNSSSPVAGFCGYCLFSWWLSIYELTTTIIIKSRWNRTCRKALVMLRWKPLCGSQLY